MTRDSHSCRSSLVFELADVPCKAILGHHRGVAVETRTSHDPSPQAHTRPLLWSVAPGSPAHSPSCGAAIRLVQDLHGLHADSLCCQVLPQSTQQACRGGSSRCEEGSGGWLASRLSGACTAVGSQLRPQGNNEANDDHPAERWVNVLTSLPFLIIGAHMVPKRRTAEGRLHAWSTVAVGATAAIYHASSGKAREVTRKADYWCIAATSVAMVKTLFADRPGVRAALNASLVLVPFRPLWVTGANTLIMQAEFARQAASNSGVRPAFRAHVLSAAAGAVAFAAEEALVERGVRGVHSLWHLLSAVAVASMGGLLSHREQQLLSRRFACAPAAPAASKSSSGSLCGLRRSASDGSLFGGDSDSCLSPGSSSGFDDSILALNDSGARGLRRHRLLHSSATSLYDLGRRSSTGSSPPGGSSPTRLPVQLARER